MLCTSCKRREADVFIERTVGKNTEKKALCENCAAKENTIPIDLIQSDRISDSPLSHTVTRSSSSKSCPLCSLTIDEIISSGTLGCPECYKVFLAELANTISYIHGASHHTGSAPKRLAMKAERERKLKELKAALSDAVKNQLFEKCVMLRDEITALESEAIL